MHTPGPWKFGGVHSWEIYSKNSGKCICSMIPIAMGITEDVQERSDNARLISAAPDLLEACKDTLELLKKDAILNHHTRSIPLHEAYELIQQAISKAQKGE